MNYHVLRGIFCFNDEYAMHIYVKDCYIYVKENTVFKLLFSRILRVKPSRKFPLQCMSTLQSTLPKSNSHKSNNRLSRRSIQVLFSLYSIVFNPS